MVLKKISILVATMFILVATRLNIVFVKIVGVAPGSKTKVYKRKYWAEKFVLPHPISPIFFTPITQNTFFCAKKEVYFCDNRKILVTLHTSKECANPISIQKSDVLRLLVAHTIFTF